MVMFVRDRELERRLIARRRRHGADRYDEVWDGIYIMSPIADIEHQDLVGEFDSILREVIRRPGLGQVLPGVNVSDRERDWKKNYRVPDVAVFLAGTSAVQRGAFWHGGPDFAVEILSPGDRARKKLAFYAKVGTREVLLVDRKPWCLDLYRLDGGQLALAGRSTVEAPETLQSGVVPLSFRLGVGEIGGRPRIEVRRSDGAIYWEV